MRRIFTWLAALAAAVPMTASAVILEVDFDAAPEDFIKFEFFGSVIVDAPHVEDGFVVTTLGSGSDVLGIGSADTWCSLDGCADSGTMALRSDSPSTVTLFQREDLGLFDFLGFDAGESVVGHPELWASGIRLIGYKSDLSSVSQDFTLDGLNDGPGGVADFQSFLSNGLFTDLLSLTMEGLGNTGFNFFSADNFRFAVGGADPVPVSEPAGLALLTAALGAAVWMRRRVRR